MNLGLQRGTVKLAPHDPAWSQLFEEERKRIKEAFGDMVIAIEHVGSTAIPGIQAKPIIDINVGVESLEIALAMKDQFEKLGYTHRPFVPGSTKGDLKEQELYVKGPESNRTHHVHVAEYGSDYWNHDLLFRDYLRTHSDEAKRYEALKLGLAKLHANDRKPYTAGKKEYIDRVVEKARQSGRR